ILLYMRFFTYIHHSKILCYFKLFCTSIYSLVLIVSESRSDILLPSMNLPSSTTTIHFNKFKLSSKIDFLYLKVIQM
ncbi:hypothetical protein, partial [Romboutsia ilealis]|uniref:hypothetical protein n=1 Tax=Romboutsia ilealis TaxID=1115758 RepID=UPI002573CC2C